MRPYALMEDSPIARYRRDLSRSTPQGWQRPYRPQVVRHHRRLQRCAGQDGQRDPRELRARRGARRQRDRSRNECHEGCRVRKFPGAASWHGWGLCGRQDAQTFRSGTNDIDAIDFVDLFLADEDQVDPDGLNDYMLVNFQSAVTNLNWRMDCGVAGRTTRSGCLPSFPPGCASRTTSTASGCSRMGSSPRTWTPLSTTRAATTCGIRQPQDVQRRGVESHQAEGEGQRLPHPRAGRVLRLRRRGDRRRRTGRAGQDCRAPRTRGPGSSPREISSGPTPCACSASLLKAFYGFEPLFQQNLARIVDDVISVIKASIELWPTLVEISYFQKGRRGLPMRRVANGEP